MKELNKILNKLDSVEGEHMSFALATVVEISGSAYRKPGARMLIGADGSSIGAISGGCLEDDIRKKASFVMHDQKAKLCFYETTDEDDPEEGLRLGCNGSIYILIEPISKAKHPEKYACLMAAVRTNSKSMLITLYNKSIGKEQFGISGLVNSNNKYNCSGFTNVNQSLSTNYLDILKARKSTWKEIDIQNTRHCAFLEYIESPLHLYIFGAGYDVLPLISMINQLSWNFTVLNARPSSKIDMPFYVEPLSINNAKQFFQEIPNPDRAAFILMSHNYNYDKNILLELLNFEMPYVGILGPRSKLAKIKDEYELENQIINLDRFLKIHSPIGLNIGAESAEEIAVSICAEVMTHFASR